jgi:hypothetical protein
MPLFKLKISIDVVVEADDVEHAREVAETEYRDVVNDTRASEAGWSKAERVLSIYDLPPKWDGQCFPYGGAKFTDDDRIAGLLFREQLRVYTNFGGV